MYLNKTVYFRKFLCWQEYVCAFDDNIIQGYMFRDASVKMTIKPEFKTCMLVAYMHIKSIRQRSSLSDSVANAREVRSLNCKIIMVRLWFASHG